MEKPPRRERRFCLAIADGVVAIGATSTMAMALGIQAMCAL